MIILFLITSNFILLLWKLKTTSSMDIKHKIEICIQEEANQEAEYEIVRNFVDAQCQCNLSESDKIWVETFQTYPSAIHYNTAFENYKHFMFFFHCCGPAFSCVKFSHRKTSCFSHLYVELWQANKDTELRILFNRSAVSKKL